MISPQLSEHCFVAAKGSCLLAGTYCCQGRSSLRDPCFFLAAGQCWTPAKVAWVLFSLSGVLLAFCLWSFCPFVSCINFVWLLKTKFFKSCVTKCLFCVCFAFCYMFLEFKQCMHVPLCIPVHTWEIIIGTHTCMHTGTHTHTRTHTHAVIRHLCTHTRTHTHTHTHMYTDTFSHSLFCNHYFAIQEYCSFCVPELLF